MNSLDILREHIEGTIWANAEQKRQFWEDARKLDNPVLQEQVAKLANRPSPFVGRVVTVQHALAHMQACDEYERAQAPTATAEAQLKTQPADGYEQAKAAWREAVAQRRHALSACEEWTKAEIDRLRKDKHELTLAWDSHVQNLRAQMQALK